MPLFDAFFINKNKPELVHIGFNRAIIDTTIYDQIMILNNPGNYKISYIVFSENFAPAKVDFNLHLDKNIDNIRFWMED